MATLRQATLFTLPDGIYPDGGNLYFRVRNQGRTREFLYRCTIKGKPTFRSLGSNARIGIKCMSPAELHEAVRPQNVHAFIAEAGIFADLQSQGLAEQLAANRSADATDPAYVSGMAVVRPKKVFCSRS